VEKLAADRADLDQAEARHKAAAQHPLAGFGGSAADLADTDAPAVSIDNGKRMVFGHKMAQARVP